MCVCVCAYIYINKQINKQINKSRYRYIDTYIHKYICVYIYILILYIWEKWLWIGTCFQQTMLDSERTSTLGQFDPPEATNDPRASDHLHRCGLFFPASAGYGWKPRANVGSLSALICDFQNDMWRFPYMGILQNGWCIMGNPMKIPLNPIKMHDLEVPLF